MPQEQLTLSKDEVVGLDKVVKCVLGELDNIRVTLSAGEAGGGGGQEGPGKTLVLHGRRLSKENEVY